MRTKLTKTPGKVSVNINKDVTVTYCKSPSTVELTENGIIRISNKVAKNYTLVQFRKYVDMIRAIYDDTKKLRVYKTTAKPLTSINITKN